MADIKNVYCLEFNVKSGDKKSESSSLTLYPGNIVSDVKIDQKSYSLSLNSLEFSKRAYEPCHVHADIKIAMGSETSELPAMQKAVDYFSSFSSVTLKIVSIEQGGNGPGGHVSKLLKEVGKLGEKYVIVDTQPTYRTGGGSTAMSVCLEIYSPDHFFTRRVYSQTYTSQKLGNIIDDAVGTFGLSSMMTVMHKYQNFLTYENAQKKDEKGNPVQEEFIQPYLVQYNESFYELIARTANRCGEWLYFEDGTLYLGWKCKPKDLKPTNLGANQFQSAVFRSRRNEEVKDDIISVSHDPIQGNGTPIGGKWFYNMEVPANEYLTPLTKGEFDSAGGWWDLQTNMWAQFAAKMLSCTSLYKGIIDFGFDAAKLAAQFAQRASQGNDKQNEKYFNSVDDKNVEHYNAKGSDAKSTTPFSTYPGTPALGGLTRNINADLYKVIRKAQLELERKSLDMEMGGNLMDLQVGSLITIPSISGDKALYMITEVTGADTVISDARAETMSIRAVPVDANKVAMFPLARKESIFPKSEQQLGYITDTDDPLRLNRVRVRFSWETIGSSPWIRMATPYASKNGAGVFYTPQKGDEVILQFYNGNMERPVVVGSLFNKENKPIYGKRTYGWVFRTPSGHLIRTSDGSEFGAFLGGIFPILGFARSFFPGLLPFNVEEDSAAKKLLGQMEITDEYGMYDIELSSAKRMISISSPFGDVKIDAYSGITINAPNGDVKIVGKNVEIVANNNLTLTSGQNLKNKSINALVRGQISGTDLAKDVAKSIFYENILKKCLDLRLLRTVFETIVKPIEGTLTIKSHRFVKLEAGKGSSHIPSSAYKRPSKGDFGKWEITVRKLTDTIGRIDPYIELLLNAYTQKFNQIHASKEALVLPQGFTIEKAAMVTKGHQDNLQLYTENEILNGYPPDQRANVLARDLTQLTNRINEFITKINTFDKRDEFKPSVLGNFPSDSCLVKEMDQIFNQVPNQEPFQTILKKGQEDFAAEANLAEEDKNTFRLRYKRMLIIKLIDQCSADAHLTYGTLDGFTVATEKEKVTQGNAIEELNWRKLISLVVRDDAGGAKDESKQDPQGSLVEILGNIPFVKASERNFYKADNSEGRILISDKENGKTIQIEDGALVEHDNGGYEEFFKQLKAVCGVPADIAGPVVPQEENPNVEENQGEGQNNPV